MKGITLSEIWNKALVSKAERELVPRNYSYASEMGYPLIDRYLKMTAVQQTNPPNDRAKRKFFAGNLYEWIVWSVFNLSGVVISKQDRVMVEDGAIPVSGKLDFLIGGKPDYDKAKKELSHLVLSEDIKWFFDKAIEFMSVEYTDEIPLSVKEIKSLSSFMFDRVESRGPIHQHQLQLLHYQMGLNIGRGGISYICREDARLREFDLQDVDGLKNSYYSELKELKGYLDAKQRPPLEPLIKWDGKFAKNSGVEYSGYLTMLYGFNEPEDYRNAVGSKVSRFNRVLVRIRDGAKMTDKNKEVIDEMAKDGYDPQELTKQMDSKIEEDGADGN